ncbi:MAG TPA: sigma-70 family RNA polymerase sigma factor [Vicinamibacterales bacterium]|nr:sigma-70 family RNA polymerase sigma factor [Vicinamibacterales bacterium]HOG29230.1 sigma-70 family RNA polymerase sigma factor [Vicinamibacterales bacterium]HOQ59961.1 sigma-70 family RNA polymerase sigma factor [Vicinamibacterales bacterium]HPK71419.1 sigma-70 family RNA polymerase sigma factor [Vicinamibacterales bacterium]HPW22124.1 sigma-70 family RNA polymerase sigma factor [Vicinamibacterales bacterium]
MPGELVVKDARALDWPGVQDEDAAFVRRCVAGENAACAALVANHQRMVYQLAYHLLGDVEEARDLSQDVFLQVFRTLDRFRGQSALRSWIYRIAVNLARNRQRWWRRRLRKDQVSLDEHVERHGPDVLTDASATPEVSLRRRETAERVWRALAGLPFEQRTAIVLREIDGLSYEEIAFALGIAVGTVKSRLTRARVALRERLREERAT